MATILFIIYMAAGYWAAGETVYANKIIIYSGNSFFARRCAVGVAAGWILIPVAILKKVFFK